MDTYPGQTDPTAVSGRRFGAFVIDGIVIAALFWGLFFATAGVTLWRTPSGADLSCTAVAAAGEKGSGETCGDDFEVTVNDKRYTAVTYKTAAWGIAGGAALLYLVLVEWILQALTGATLGKAIFGIRTVDEQGQPPGLGKQLIRAVLWIVDGLCNGLVAAILILTTKGHRRLGDMAAKTFVVRKSSKGSPVVVPGLATAAVGAGAAAGYTAAPGYATTPPAPVAPPATPTYGAPPPPGAMGATPPVAPDQTMLAPDPVATPEPPGTDPTVVDTPPPAVDQTIVAPEPTQSAPASAPAADGPQWDAARGAYIQWDPAGNRWLTYDDAAGQWKPLE